MDNCHAGGNLVTACFIFYFWPNVALNFWKFFLKHLLQILWYISSPYNRVRCVQACNGYSLICVPLYDTLGNSLILALFHLLHLLLVLKGGIDMLCIVICL